MSKVVPLPLGQVDLEDSEYTRKGVNELAVPSGLFKFSSDRMIYPHQFLERTLRPGEFVIKEFDCFFPEEKLKAWKLIALCIITCGFYLLYLFLYLPVQRFIQSQPCLICCFPVL